MVTINRCCTGSDLGLAARETEIASDYKSSSTSDLYEFGMDECRRDRISIIVAVSQRISVATGDHASSSSSSSAALLLPPVVSVSGCSLSSVNGRYIDGGRMNDALRFQNVKGWAIFRQMLPEIPELGIYEDSCYDASQGPSLKVLLDRRAGN